MFSRNSLVVAAAAALVTAIAAPASAASAPAVPSVLTAGTCSAQATITIYTYYSNSSYTTIVGTAERDCDGVYTLTSGYTTIYVKTKTIACPY